MRILVLHSRYLSGAASGENRVVEDEVRLLREAGHTVRAWTPAVALAHGRPALRAGVEAVWSRGAAARARGLVRACRIDLVHCHNLFPALSPSVLSAVSADARVLLSLHNYRLVCLPATLLRNGRICEDCVGRLPWRGVAHACYRGSRPASAALFSSLAVHRGLGTFRCVDLYLAVSRFVRSKHVHAGLPPEAIRVKPNFAWPASRREGSGEYFLYLGRLSDEKGIDVLLRAWRPAFPRLVVAGDGPLARELRRETSGVEFTGLVSPSDVPRLISRARALLLPSRWYETAGKVVLEAYASGVPVIASRIGGLPEVVAHGASGLLVAPGHPAAWTEALERLVDDGESERLGVGAFELWRTRFNPERALADLEAAYRDVVGGRAPDRRGWSTTVGTEQA